MTRAEHLEWAKRRALEYCSLNEPVQAFTSLASDFGKHPELKDHSGLQLGMMMLMGGQLTTPEAMSEFIRGFN